MSEQTELAESPTKWNQKLILRIVTNILLVLQLLNEMVKYFIGALKYRI